MWWVSIKNSLLVVMILAAAMSCDQSKKTSAKVYLASSLMPLADGINHLAKDGLLSDLNFLSSSAIVKQIEQGAPCDVVILADEAWQNRLIALNLVEAQPHLLAGNTLVMASLVKAEPAADVKDALAKITPPKKLIIGDPDFVPLGAYTKQALEHLGVYQQLLGQLIRAHSARQASVLLKQGAAHAAILYHSDAKSEGFFVVAAIDATYHRPIEYPLLICKKAVLARAKAVKELFLSQKMRKILREKGFLTVP